MLDYTLFTYLSNIHKNKTTEIVDSYANNDEAIYIQAMHEL